MDHPANPWSPCRWFTRDYGFISPTPFNWLDERGWQLETGESIRLRYRIVVSSERVISSAMDKLYGGYAGS
jgi:hypothetical protein